MTLADLQARIDFARRAIERNAEQSRSMPAGRTSKFWADIFDQRQIYPDANAVMVCRREGTIVGVGDDPQGTIERERAYSERVHHIFSRMVGKDFMAGLSESSFGSPLAFEHDGILRSANFWINAATTKRVLEFSRQFGKHGPLRVLEIGPGWGACVYQLHQSTEVESYTLVDLPENLYISTIHLGLVLPERKVEFVDVAGEAIGEIPKNAIYACLPGAIGRLKAEYDLVLNSFSLQEMDIESVNAYIDWVETILSPEGIFVSLNSHGKAGVQKPSDYRYQNFHIHHWGVFRSEPAGFFNTIPYEVVVGRRRPASPNYSDAYQDAVGELMQLGLDKDLAEFCDSLVHNRLTPQQQEILGGYSRLFTATNDAVRLAELASLRDIDKSAIWPFVSALLALVRNEPDNAMKSFDDSLALGLSGFARVRANVFRGGLALKAGRKVECGLYNGLDPAFVYPEAKDILSNGDFDRAIDHINRSFKRHQSESQP